MREFTFSSELCQLADDVVNVVTDEAVSQDTRNAVIIVLRTLLNHRDSDDLGFQGTIIQQAIAIVNCAKGLEDVFYSDKISDCQRLVQRFLDAEKAKGKAAFEARRAAAIARIKARQEAARLEKFPQL
jgi:hypothetical protein